MRGWVFAAILALVVIGGIVTVAAVTDHDGWDRHRDDEITRVVGADGQETIVIRDDGRPFFPFGIFFIPLIIFLVFALMRGFFWRGGRGGPWGNGDGPSGRGAPGWFDEWHRQAHATGGPATTPSPPAAGTSEERSE